MRSPGARNATDKREMNQDLDANDELEFRDGLLGLFRWQWVRCVCTASPLAAGLRIRRPEMSDAYAVTEGGCGEAILLIGRICGG